LGFRVVAVSVINAKLDTRNSKQFT